MEFLLPQKKSCKIKIYYNIHKDISKQFLIFLRHNTSKKRCKNTRTRTIHEKKATKGNKWDEKGVLWDKMTK